MVDLLTTVTAEHGLDASRASALGRALAELGFEPSATRRRAAWTSPRVEAGAAKRHLRARGFADREFRVILEYTRRWGIM